MKNINRDALNSLLKLFRTLLYLLVAAHFFSGCTIVSPMAELKYTEGSVAESLSSNVSLSFASTDQSISGSGLLMFSKPDQIRLVLISPFGSVLQEVYVHGEHVSIVDTGNGIAYSGSYMELPDKGNFSGWRNIHWLIDIDPPESSRRTTVVARTNRYGYQEKAAFEHGLLTSKTNAAGDSVWYNRYTSVNGVPFPLEIIYKTAADEKFTILFEEPEINISIAEGTFKADLSKFRVYPLSVLR